MNELVIYWDIDGTLLTTRRQGLRAWSFALERVIGRSIDLGSYESAGKPDPLIAAELLQLCGAGGGHALPVAELLREYVSELPNVIDPRIGGALPGVRRVLDALLDSPGVTNALLTGNMRAAAVCKLRSYGLNDAFLLGGYGDDGSDRPTIGAAARRRAARTLPQGFGEVIVGDTPLDVECGAILGIPAIGVATGSFSIEALQTAGASRVIATLPDPEQFLNMLRDLMVWP